ncbi:hypothetical protein HY493_05540 [Candidatus Woesearchaeota archaeon]|nr:hypothetical protein [Candidatus Woesearchaeota archaeon]
MKKRLASHHDLLGEHHHRWKVLRWFEWFTDMIIPYLLVILAIELVLDNPLWTLYSLEPFGPLIAYLDQFILFFFVVDLTFKWFHVQNVVKFVKLYWLDILAVLPLYLGFRIYARFTSLALAGEEIAEAQKVAHEIVLAREAKLLREAEALAKEEKLLREARPLVRVMQTVERSLRLISGQQEVARAGMRHAILKSES